MKHPLLARVEGMGVCVCHDEREAISSKIDQNIEETKHVNRDKYRFPCDVLNECGLRTAFLPKGYNHA